MTIKSKAKCLPFFFICIDSDVSYHHFFAYMGVANSLVFAIAGAAYGTAKSSIGIANLGMVSPNKIFKALVPIIMAGILGIYGLIVSVLITNKINDVTGTNAGETGYKLFWAGLCVGMSALASGLAIGVAGEAGVRAFAQTEDIFVGMVLVLIFSEAIGLYGFIVAIIMMSN